MEVPKIRLNSGADIPVLGLGTWLADPFPGLTVNAVEAAIRVGYRHIDCAFIYQNEDEVGEAIEKVIKEGVVKREDLFITSKLWSCYFDPEDVETACRECLARLRTDYVDLFLIHAPFGVKRGELFPSPATVLGYDPDKMAKTWEAMEALVPAGLVKAIGVSNFTITKTETLLKTAKMVPAVNQVESNIYFQQDKLRQYCKNKGITFVAYSPLGSPGRPEKSDSDPVLMDDPVVKEIAEKLKATPAQVCITFLLQRGDVTIPKSTDDSRITENFKSLEVQISAEDMGRLKALDKNLRLNTFDWLFEPAVDSIDSAWDVQADKAFAL